MDHVTVVTPATYFGQPNPQHSTKFEQVVKYDRHDWEDR